MLNRRMFMTAFAALTGAVAVIKDITPAAAKAPGITPSYYTTREGGYWKKWPGGAIDRDVLTARSKWHVSINNLEVHALAFGQPKKGVHDSCRIWDCINGFRKGFSDLGYSIYPPVSLTKIGDSDKYQVSDTTGATKEFAISGAMVSLDPKVNAQEVDYQHKRRSTELYLDHLYTLYGDDYKAYFTEDKLERAMAKGRASHMSQDMIYNISPVDSPLQTARSGYHEWVEDTLKVTRQ